MGGSGRFDSAFELSEPSHYYSGLTEGAIDRILKKKKDSLLDRMGVFLMALLLVYQFPSPFCCEDPTITAYSILPLHLLLTL